MSYPYGWDTIGGIDGTNNPEDDRTDEELADAFAEDTGDQDIDEDDLYDDSWPGAGGDIDDEPDLDHSFEVESALGSAGFGTDEDYGGGNYTGEGDDIW